MEPGAGAPSGPGLGAQPESPDAATVVELRVHGVSGTPPATMLADPMPVRVAGDQLAGFYRRALKRNAPPPADGVMPEAFSWGSLTSGAAARALWLLLLPFTLANVCFWMRPRRRGVADVICRWLLRVLALSLTSTLVLAAVGVAVDLIAWQCAAPGQACAVDRSWLRWLSAGWWSEPGRRLLIGGLVPAAVIGLLWYLGRRTWSSYESVRAPLGDLQPDLPLAEPSFWSGRKAVRELRCLHVAVAVSTLDAMLVVPGLAADRASRTGWTGLGVALVIAIAAVVAVALVGLGVRRVVDRRAASSDRFWTPAAMLVAAAITLLAVGGWYLAAPARPRWPDVPTLPGYTTTITALFTTQVAVLLLVALLVLAQRRHVPASAALAGFGAPVFGSVALLVASAFAAGATFRTADFLDRGGTQNQPTETAASMLQPPPQYSWAALGFLLTLAALVLLMLVVGLARLAGPRLHRAERAYEDEVRASEDGTDARCEDPYRLRRIARARLAAALTDTAPALIATLVLPGAVITVAVTVIVLLSPDPPAVLAQQHLAAVAPTVGFLTNLGTWLVSGFALALLLLGRAAYRTLRLRRVVGILWDLGTFWPRAAHPLAPPCYAERAVPDLVRRASWLAGSSEVLLSAHSQGTALSAAALLQMPREAIGRIRLLTYGCPLHRLYVRWFPAYFDDATLEWLALYLHDRWINLTRRTDPIGGPVFPDDEQRGARVDRELRDPVHFACPPTDTVPPPLLQHSDYWADPDYYIAVDALVRGPKPASRPEAAS
jgi:hypothetical protein